MKYILRAISPITECGTTTKWGRSVWGFSVCHLDLFGVCPGVEFILGILSLCHSSWLCLCRQDLGGYAVCHSTCETDTKSFSCDLFELMVQNIVKHPAHPEAISKVHWADTNGLWYTSMVKTHMPDPHIFTWACTCTEIYKQYLWPWAPKVSAFPLKPRQFMSLVKCDKYSRIWYTKTKQNKKSSMCVDEK